MKTMTLLLLSGLAVCLGCAAGSPPPETRTPHVGNALGPKNQHLGRQAAERDNKGLAAGQLPRKVITTAKVNLVVSDLVSARDALTKLVTEHGGYVAESEATNAAGSPRSAWWTVRVPASSYDAFLTAILGLGIPEKVSTDSEDVSEQFYDLEARVRNKKVEEDRLLKHLEKSTGKLEEILAVEKELSRVREEIEQMEGKLRRLTNLSDLTTVTVTLNEIKDYVPPQTPGFGQRISETFLGSVGILEQGGKGIVLVIAALVPWLPFVLLTGAAVWWLRRGKVKRSSRAAEHVEP